MNKAELVAEIAKNTGLTKVDSERATEALLNTVAATLKKGDEVRLVGFGTFSVTKRPASTGRNPREGGGFLLIIKDPQVQYLGQITGASSCFPGS